MALIDTRAPQMFPTLDAQHIETAKRFASGPARDFAPGETLYAVGDRGVPMWLVLEGSIEAARRDGIGHQAHIGQIEKGQFSGEVSQLDGRSVLVMGYAGSKGCKALPFEAAQIRALVIGSAEIGEIIMRAFILRRVALLQDGTAGAVLVGRRGNVDFTRLQGFLSRNGYPCTVFDCQTDEGNAVMDQFGIHADELPLMICPNGKVLKRPTDADAAACLGIIPELHLDQLYDVVVVGAGPAGLATAVYGASEGLSVLVLDQRAIGGQAGASARIENYLGFPTGITGQALAGRAFNQAQKFGAEIAIPMEIAKLSCDPDGVLRPELASGQKLRTRSVVIASGARYRRLDIPNLADFEGAGVSYWASPIEAKLCEGEDVALVGAGNSAGQAVVYLAPKVKHLHMVVRGKGLEATMSQYLIDRIKALKNVTVHVQAEVVALQGDTVRGLEGVTFRNRADGKEWQMPLRHLFLLIGADPNVAWAKDCTDLDEKGFIVTGKKFGKHGDGTRQPMPLETTMPGVFAVGDVRAGSTKRVAAAVGEGAAAVAQIHAFLAT